MGPLRDYPYYKASVPRDKAGVIKFVLKMARYWGKMTGRNQGLTLSRLNAETVTEIKTHARWYTSKGAAETWLSYQK